MNYILLAAFTTFASIIVGLISSYSESNEVLNAFIITFAMSLALELYALASREINFSIEAFIVVFSSLILVGIFFLLGKFSYYLYGVICLSGVVLFGLFLTFDVKRLLLINKDADCLFVTLLIYSDLIFLIIFLIIVACFLVTFGIFLLIIMVATDGAICQDRSRSDRGIIR